MNLGNLSKTLGAGIGGVMAGTVTLPFMPDSTPWYGYIIMYAVVILLPALTTYFAPANKE